VSLAQAQSRHSARIGHLGAREGLWQTLEQLRFKPNVHPLKQDVVGDTGVVLEILMGALALVLLLVCANVANLMQVRAQAGRQEFAIRAALGAGRGRIVPELMVESLALGVLGGAMGLALAYAGLRLLVTHGPTALPRVGEISTDSTSILFALACSLGSSVLFGLIAVLESGFSRRLQNVRGASPGMEQLRTQNALVVTQVALALVLLIAAGLLLRSLVALRAVRPGFTHPEQIQTVRLFIPEAQVPEPKRVAQMQADILHNLARNPGVAAAAFATALPLEPEYHNGNVGTRLIAGWDFTWNDLLSQRRVAIASENMARENWGEPGDALGKRIRICGTDLPWSVLVGVAENVYDDGVDRQPPAKIYFPAGVDPAVRPRSPGIVRRRAAFAIRSSRAGTEGLSQRSYS
jgi:FtsX-like permease family